MTSNVVDFASRKQAKDQELSIQVVLDDPQVFIDNCIMNLWDEYGMDKTTGELDDYYRFLVFGDLVCTFIKEEHIWAVEEGYALESEVHEALETSIGELFSTEHSTANDQ